MLLCVLFPTSTLCADTAGVDLTPQEQAWIAEHPVVRLGVGRAFPPFQYMDEGEIFQGIASDYVKLLQQRLGLELQIQKHLTWNQVVAKTTAGDIDAWACVAPTPKRRKYMIFSKPYLSFPWVIFTRKDMPLVAGIEDLKDKRVAVVKTLANYSRLSHIPDLHFHFVSSVAEGLTSVSVCKADAYMLNLAVGDYLINKHGLTNLRVASATGWGTNDLCFASRRDWPLLARILQKGLDSVTQHEYDTIVSKWLHADLHLGMSWSQVFTWSVCILAGVVLVFGVMLYWNRRLQREIRERHAAEHALQEAYAEVDELVRQRTAALQESQEHLSLALDTVSAFTWEVRVHWEENWPRFDSLLFSPNAASLFGTNEALDMRLDQLPLDEKVKPKIRHLMENFLRGEESVLYYECLVLTQNDGPLWHAHAVHVNRQENVRPNKAYGISVNIHHRKEIEEELKRHASKQDKLNVRLLELDRVKSTIITNVSHELRTPLTSLLGFANLTRKNFIKHFKQFADTNETLLKQASRIEKNLAVIESESRRLTRLITDFLDLSKIQSERMQWNDQPVDMGELLMRVAEVAKVLFLEKPDISFQIDIPDSLPQLTGDPDRLEQVFQNLLHNAYKFTSEGYVRLGCRREADMLVISLEDTGTGIAAEDLEHIFTRFHRIENKANDDNPGGTGLGLSICKEIVNHYDGDILVRSEPGRGSEFQVRLPL